MKLEVKIEIRSIVKKLTSQPVDGNTHNFTVSVQGLNGNHIEHFVKHVEFHLPSNSKQVKRNPPYIISGYANTSFRLPIEIFLHTSEAHNKVRYSYYVYLPHKPVENAVNVKTLTFLNVPPDFRQRLLLGGAEAVKESDSVTVETQVKSEPVETVPSQNVASTEFEVVTNKEAANSENKVSKDSAEHLVCKTEPTKITDTINKVSNIRNEVQNELPNSCVQTEDISGQNGMLLIQDIYSFDDLMKENEVLKKENEELLKKFNKHEGVIGIYIEKLPVLQHDCSAVNTELSYLEKKSEDMDAEISSLKSSIQKLMSEILPQNNQDSELKAQKKKQRKTAIVSSSSVSESFSCISTLSPENELNTENSYPVLSNDRGVVMNEGTISHAIFDLPTPSAESNVIQDTSKNQLKSDCGTSQNKPSSSLSHLSVNTCDTVQNASIADASQKTVAENSHNLSVQNKSSSFNPCHQVSSVCPSENTMSFINSSLSGKNVCIVSPLPNKRISTPKELPLSKENISTFSEELRSAGQNSLQKESNENLTGGPIQDCTKKTLLSENSPDRKIAVVSSLKPKEMNPEDSNILEVSQGQNSSEKEPCLNTFSLETQQCTKVLSQVSLFERRNTDSFGGQADKNMLDEVTLGELLPTKNEVFDLNPEKMDVILTDSSTGQNHSNKKLRKSLLEKPDQQYEDDIQIIENEEHCNSSPKEKDHVPKVSKTGLGQNITKEINNNCENDEIQVLSSNQKDAEVVFLSCSKRDPVKEIQLSTKEDNLTKVPDGATQKPIKRKPNEPLSKRKSMKFTNLSHGEGNTVSSNCESLSAVNNSLHRESIKFLSTKEISEQPKGGLQVDSNQQKKDPVVSNFTHLKNPSLKMKRTSSLPIPVAPKKPCRTELNSCSINQKNSQPHTTPINSESNSVKHSTVTKQPGSHVNNSLNTITTSSKILNETKNTSPQNESTLKSPMAGNQDLKKQENGTKSSKSIGFIFKGFDETVMSEIKQNYYVNLLTVFFTDPKRCPDVSTLKLLAISHLLKTKKNYLQPSRNDRGTGIFLPLSESYMVTALLEVERKGGVSKSKLTENILNAIPYLLLGPKNTDVFGFASLCRVFTEICRRKNDLMKPLSLSAELLKRRVRCAPYFVASIAGVWREPFMLSNDQSEEAKTLLGCISLGVRKRTKQMDEIIWYYTSGFLSHYFGLETLKNVIVGINFLKEKIISNCIKNSHEKSWMVTSSFVILASLQSKEFTKKNMVEDYIIPNLSRFAYNQPNEKAFALFCELCVDVHCATTCMKYEVLKKYFKQAPKYRGPSFVKEWAGVSLVKYMILIRNDIPHEFTVWIENNKEKSNVIKKFKEFYLKKNVYYRGLLAIRDIIFV